MELLQSFILNNSKHEVRMVWEGETPLFRAEDIGKVLGLKNFRSSTQTFTESEKITRVQDLDGGSRECLFLTEAGTYRLINRSNKEIARPFQDWIISVIVEIRKKGYYELEENFKEKLKENEDKSKELIKQAIKETAEKAQEESFYNGLDRDHKTFVDAFENTSLVYFGFVKMIGDKQLIKIGSTEDVRTRAYDLKNTFGNIKFFKVFPSELYRQYEKDLQQHRYILPYKYNDVIHDGHTSREAFLMTQDEVTRAINVATRRRYKFRQQVIANDKIEKAKIDLENRKLDLEEKKLEMQDKIHIPPEEDSKPSAAELEEINLEEKEKEQIPQKFVYIDDNRNFTQARGDKVQLYSSDGKTLLKTYSSAISAMRDKNLSGPTRPKINDAAQNNTLYRGYRWALLDRELPDDTLQSLAPTVEDIVEPNKGFVAMLNLDKNLVINVFCDQKAASADRKFKTGAAISKAIKQGTKSGGHYFAMWASLSENLKNDYLKNNTLPEPRENSNGNPVLKIDPTTKKVIKKYNTTNDVIKEHKMSRISLHSAIETGSVRFDAIWKFA